MEERGITVQVDPPDEPTTDDEVFYNTAMVTHRDISTACLAVMQDRFDKDLTICDALSASGIRGLRYVNEIDGIDKAILNDMNPAAIDNITENIAHNDIDTSRIEVTNQDANRVLTDNYRQLDFVDIDPFGSPTPYLDSTARSLYHDSCVGITATDLAPLAGSYRKVCERRYGATPVKNAFSHETGLRILLSTVFHALSRYDYAFKPLLCHYERHYYRIFGRVRESKKTCNRLLDNIGYLAHCRNCEWRSFIDMKSIPNTCPHCNESINYVGGPLWTGKIADQQFADDVHNWLETNAYEEAADLVTTIRDEAEIITPFYDTHQLGSALDNEAPRKQALIHALQEQGYRATETHFSPKGVRTDAPHETVLEHVES